jgi:hypothetical protein
MREHSNGTRGFGELEKGVIQTVDNPKNLREIKNQMKEIKRIKISMNKNHFCGTDPEAEPQKSLASSTKPVPNLTLPSSKTQHGA